MNRRLANLTSVHNSFFLTYLLHYLATSSLRIEFRFQAGGHERQPNLTLVCLCCSIFCYGCIFAFVVFGLVFQEQAERLAGKKSPNMTHFVLVGHKTQPPNF